LLNPLVRVAKLERKYKRRRIPAAFLGYVAWWVTWAHLSALLEGRRVLAIDPAAVFGRAELQRCCRNCDAGG
jgi:hypothetical protein